MAPLVTTSSDRWLTTGTVAGLGILAGQGFSRFSFGLLFPRMGASLVGSTSTSSFLAALYAASYLVNVAVLIYVTRHAAPLRLLVFGVMTSTGGLLLLSLARSEFVVATGLVIAGLGAAYTYVPALSFVSATTTETGRSKALGLASAGIGVGIMLARLFEWSFKSESTASGWRYVWASEAAVGAIVSALILLHALRHPSPIEDQGVPVGHTRRLPNWLALGMAYLCFGVAYTIYSNLAVKGWEMGGLSGTGAATSFFFVAPAQIGGGILLLHVLRRGLVRLRWAFSASFVFLALAMAEVAEGGQHLLLSIASAVVTGGVSAGIPAQVVVAIRTRVRKGTGDRDAATTIFGVITLLYAVGGMVGLLGGSVLSRHRGSLTSTFWVASLVSLVGAACALRAVAEDKL